jgi:hypothetical protein
MAAIFTIQALLNSSPLTPHVHAVFFLFNTGWGLVQLGSRKKKFPFLSGKFPNQMRDFLIITI